MNQTKRESAKLVLAKLKIFYEKDNIPVISKRKTCEKIIKLLDGNAKIREMPLKRRSTPSCIKMVQEMECTLAKTFSLWPANVELLVKTSADMKFLLSMKIDRLATFGQCDKVLADKLQRWHKRQQSEAKRREKMSTHLTIALYSDIGSSDEIF